MIRRRLPTASGLGNPIKEPLEELGLPVEGVAVTSKSKEKLFTHLRLLLEEGALTLPEDSVLLGELNAMESVRTRVGGYHFSHRPGTYDDRAFTLALACYGAKTLGGGVVVPI